MKLYSCRSSAVESVNYVTNQISLVIREFRKLSITGSKLETFNIVPEMNL